MTGSHNLAIRSTADHAAREYFHHSSAQRIATDVVIVEALRKQYPQLKLTIVPQTNCNLLSFVGSGQATISPIDDSTDHVYAPLSWREYIPPARRLNNRPGFLMDVVHFGKFTYKWRDNDFLLYVVNGRDGSASYPAVVVNYILSSSEHTADALITAAASYGNQLHDEVWVFDKGYWQKSHELWQSVQKSEWEDVILDKDMKKAIINDVSSFFNSRSTYERLKVPWKRGIIYHGPPGNGKTISIKAMMHSLYRREDPVPTLYVRTLASFAGPEYALSQIFTKARQEAPCYLVFEDLDSIVSDNVRSYFLNEVDGLRANDGILMVGSTNHLDRLDPGISKRPSRFDRKYYFPNPNFADRVAYCQYWQGKLSDNEDIDFPDKLCEAVAKITDKFSFAYMQEAFVAALLSIATSEDTASGGGGDDDDDDKDLDDLLLWREIKKQVKILREEMGEEESIGST